MKKKVKSKVSYSYLVGYIAQSATSRGTISSRNGVLTISSYPPIYQEIKDCLLPILAEEGFLADEGSYVVQGISLISQEKKNGKKK